MFWDWHISTSCLVFSGVSCGYYRLGGFLSQSSTGAFSNESPTIQLNFSGPNYPVNRLTKLSCSVEPAALWVYARLHCASAFLNRRLGGFPPLSLRFCFQVPFAFVSTCGGRMIYYINLKSLPIWGLLSSLITKHLQAPQIHNVHAHK